MASAIIDSQQHIWAPDGPERPWSTAHRHAIAEPSPFVDGTLVVDAGEAIAQMDALGVDAAILVTSARHYGTDNSYALEAAARHPDRFGVMGRVDPADAAIEETIAGFRDHPGGVGVRIFTVTDADRARMRGGEYEIVFATCERHEIPLYAYPVGVLSEFDAIAARHPGLQLVIDHLGLAQRPFPDVPADPFERIGELLALARHANVAVKLSGIPMLSWGAFPYPEVWPHVHAILEAFGCERVLWGSDWTRGAGIATYEEGLRWLTDAGELSDAELALVLGGALQRVLRWSPAG